MYVRVRVCVRACVRASVPGKTHQSLAFSIFLSEKKRVCEREREREGERERERERESKKDAPFFSLFDILAHTGSLVIHVAEVIHRLRRLHKKENPF